MNSSLNCHFIAQIRTKSIGSTVVFQLNEYANDLYLTDEEWTDPLMTTYMDCASFAITLYNDIASYEKELKENHYDGSRLINCVALIMSWNKCSVEVAMEKTRNLYFDYEKKTKDYSKDTSGQRRNQ